MTSHHRRSGRSRHGRPRRFAFAATAAAALLAAALTTAPRSGASPASTPHAAGSEKILLALGDSLAAGYEPADRRNPPPLDPATGRRDQGYPGGYAADLAHAEHLRLLDLGCPGETTASFSTQPAQGACTSAYKEPDGARNQEAAALATLAHHRGRVALVTFDLGANDVDDCDKDSTLDASCLAAVPGDLALRLPSILQAIRLALRRDDPGARFAAMTYYDPFLALAYEPGGARGVALAALSLGGLDGVDGALTAIYERAGVLVAPVADLFSTGSLLPATTYEGRSLPRDVGVVCRDTFMCPIGHGGDPDIHPNKKGYALIARAFERVLAEP